jgi:flagellar motor protein MotB
VRKRREHGGDNTDRWVVSYADFITLLFAFFTTMYAISHVDVGKLEKFAGSMKSAFKASGSGSAWQVIDGISPASPDVIGIEKEFNGEEGRKGRYRLVERLGAVRFRAGRR